MKLNVRDFVFVGALGLMAIVAVRHNQQDHPGRTFVEGVQGVLDTVVSLVGWQTQSIELVRYDEPTFQVIPAEQPPEPIYTMVDGVPQIDWSEGW